MSITAAEIMTAPVVSVPPSASLAEIAELLAEKRLSAVPVCDDGGRMLGIVSEQDVLRPFRESVRVKQDWWLEHFAEGEALSQTFLDYLRRDTRSAAELMSRHVVTAGEGATVPELAELMVKHAVKRVPIVRDGRVIGIVARADLVRAIAKAPALLV